MGSHLKPHWKFTYSSCSFKSFSSSFSDEAVFERVASLLLDLHTKRCYVFTIFLFHEWSPSSIVTSQLLPTGLLAELLFPIVTSGHHFSTAPNWSSYRTGLLNRHFWSSLLNSSQLVFLPHWSSQSQLLVITSQLLPTGLPAELVFSIVTSGRHSSIPPNWSSHSPPCHRTGLSQHRLSKLNSNSFQDSNCITTRTLL